MSTTSHICSRRIYEVIRSLSHFAALPEELKVGDGLGVVAHGVAEVNHGLAEVR